MIRLKTFTKDKKESMLTGDHIVISVTLAAVVSRKLQLPFFQVSLLLIAVNLIDVDHIPIYYLQHDWENSLTLNPLHIYAGPLLFLLSLIGLFKKPSLNWIYAVIAGYTLHLFGDALAHFAGYSVTSLLIIACFEYTVFFYVLRQAQDSLLKHRLLAVTLFLWALNTAYVVYTIKILNIHTTDNIWMVTGTQLLLLLSILIYWPVMSRFRQTY